MATQDTTITLGQLVLRREDCIEVDWESGPIRAREEEVRFMYTTGLRNAIAVAVSGIYPRVLLRNPLTEYYNRFMMCTTEAEMENKYPALRDQVEAAKALGLQAVIVGVTAPDLARNLRVPGDHTEEDVLAAHSVQRSLMRHLRRLVGSNIAVDQQPQIHYYPYHEYCMEGHNKTIETSMALFRDRSVMVESAVFGGEVPSGEHWRVYERQWSSAPPSAEGLEVPSGNSDIPGPEVLAESSSQYSRVREDERPAGADDAGRSNGSGGSSINDRPPIFFR
ncbi:uncharacterized protein PG998_008517 [Apiospora kogelbergensis]|uniref:uncharacterized protein n=1 Tax=Apiospora kogelbergensis TaxID=1337665 RepID=UPI003130E311